MLRQPSEASASPRSACTESAEFVTYDATGDTLCMDCVCFSCKRPLRRFGLTIPVESDGSSKALVICECAAPLSPTRGATRSKRTTRPHTADGLRKREETSEQNLVRALSHKHNSQQQRETRASKHDALIRSLLSSLISLIHFLIHPRMQSPQLTHTLSPTHVFCLLGSRFSRSYES